jgi:hypothetical protein
MDKVPWVGNGWVQVPWVGNGLGMGTFVKPNAGLCYTLREMRGVCVHLHRSPKVQVLADRTNTPLPNLLPISAAFRSHNQRQTLSDTLQITQSTRVFKDSSI